MQKEMGISREALLRQNMLRYRPNVVLDTERTDNVYVPLIPFSKQAIVNAPIDANIIPPGSGSSDVPALVDNQLNIEPIHGTDSSGKLGSVAVGLGPVLNDTPAIGPTIIDSARDDTPYYPVDLPTVTSPSPTVSNALTVTSPATPVSDPISQITTLLDLFENRFAGATPATTANVGNQQGGYIIVPGGNGNNSTSSPLLIWLAVAGIVLTIGFYIYERRQRK